MFEKTVILSFDDAVSNHASFVAPLLKQLGFHATFFVCEFPPDFATNQEQYMTWRQIRSLCDDGFEIGNHTLNHTGVETLSAEAFAAELEALERKLAANGIPPARTFAYPGGPGAARLHPVLHAKGYRFARTAAGRPWRFFTDDPYDVPAYAVHGEETEFFRAITEAEPDCMPVLLYHGVPEFSHPWVNTDPTVFEREMRYLADRQYRVLSFADLPAPISPKASGPPPEQ